MLLCKLKGSRVRLRPDAEVGGRGRLPDKTGLTMGSMGMGLEGAGAERANLEKLIKCLGPTPAWSSASEVGKTCCRGTDDGA